MVEGKTPDADLWLMHIVVHILAYIRTYVYNIHICTHNFIFKHRDCIIECLKIKQKTEMDKRFK